MAGPLGAGRGTVPMERAGVPKRYPNVPNTLVDAAWTTGMKDIPARDKNRRGLAEAGRISLTVRRDSVGDGRVRGCRTLHGCGCPKNTP